jgi:hypothetical protein
MAEISPTTRYRLLVGAIALPSAWIFWVSFLSHPLGASNFLGWVVVTLPVLMSAIALLTCLASLLRPRRWHCKILLGVIPVLMADLLCWLLFYRAHPPSTWQGFNMSAGELADFWREVSGLAASLLVYAVSLYPLVRSRRWLS